jgi:hypothetical protein
LEVTFSISQLVIIDLEIETIGITVASIFIVLKSKKEDATDIKVIAILVMIFGTILASGYFGSVKYPMDYAAHDYATIVLLFYNNKYYFNVLFFH